LTAAISPVAPSVVSPVPAPVRIALFAATGWEMRAVRAAFPGGYDRTYAGHRVFVSRVGTQEFWLIRTGIGHDKATRAASWLLRQQPFHLAVSTGFACALVPATIGTLLMSREVNLIPVDGSTPSPPLRSSGGSEEEFVAFMTERRPAVQTGRFVSVDQIVVRAQEKQRYARITGAVGLDMESAALAMVSQQAHVPFLILRTVSDLLHEDLPLDFNLFLRPAGWAEGIGAVLMAPWSLCALDRLRRQSRRAAAQLTDVFRAYAEAVAPQTHPRRAEQA
jgi:adenosylhomocysteine nucleosidase